MKILYAGRKWKLNLLLAGLSGILYGLSFPKFGMWFLLPFSIAILIYISLDSGAIIPFLSGLTANLFILYWLVPTMTVYGNLSLPFSFILYFILSLYLSIYWAVFGEMTRRFYAKFSFAPFILPSIWVGLEYLRGHAFTGFPWCLCGYSLYKLLPLIQITDITGIYGVSFLVFYWGVLLFESWRMAVERKNFFSFILLSVLTIFLTSGTIIYGVERLGFIRKKMGEAEKIKVGLVQGNFEQDVKWSPEYVDITMNVYLSLSRASRFEGAELIVWPETAVPFFYQHNRIYRNEMLNFVKDSGATLIFGSPAYTRYRGQTLYHNRIYLLNPSGEEFYYDKLHLVPFGEYIPLKKIFKFAKRFVSAMGDMDPGKELKLLPFRGHFIGGYICYEAIFPELVRLFKKKGAELFVNITNDAWFGRTSAPYQHISMAALRSVENRVWTVRVANTGVSAIITPEGKIENPTPIFERKISSGKAGFMKINTFYSLHGDIFAWLNLFLALLFLLAGVLRK